ncbi:hypothetical protein [Hymenobacter lucidus]|uniref:PEGA domain-containing protein n=1 Tax=Hymenobacter lucidus TaxID=2880930 RepID=A0ABS8AM37_9BACT|nr:hypothetical protein [Hymenobacter lucidus]MCB2406698.1 hypothetical protein [Hymenobacter lucidus]
MRFLYLLLLSICLLPGAARAQAPHDVILHIDGREVNARVLVITPADISYLPVDTVASDTLHVAASQVFLIRYANGTKEVIQHAPAAPSLSGADARSMGMLDARKNFRAPGAFWGTFGATVAYAPVGLVVGTVIAASRPSPVNIITSDRALLQNPDYMSGYRRQAQRQKLGKAAAGFGTGLGTVLVATAIILVSVFN